jgi:insecticidal toxin complex protein TccC
MAAAQWIDAHTPTVSVADSRGLAVRDVAYCRHPLNPSIETRITRNHFDAAGRLVASWDPRLWGTAPRPNLATTHNLQGQPLLVDSVDAGWQLGLLDQAGMARSFWDGRGSQRHTEYDELQRPTSVTEQMKNDTPRVSERFAYAEAGDEFAEHNQCGQLIRHDHPAGSRSHCEYGVGGLLLAEETRFLLDLAPPDWSSESTNALLEDEVFRTAQQYGPSGEMLCQTDAGENRRTFDYNPSGELLEIRLKLAGAIDPPQVLVGDIRYDALGKVNSERAANGLLTTARYAAEDGRLTGLLSCDARGTPLQHFEYAYDPVGNISSVQDKVALTRYFNQQRIEPINRYRYDSLYQLVEATGREVSQPSHGPALPAWQTTPLDPNQLRNYTQTFNYDAAGNLQTRHHSGVETFEMFTLPGSNRSVADEGSLVDGFDANGNQRELLRGQQMSWDIGNQLSRVTMVRREDGPDDSECYFYDSPGHRLRKVRLTETARRTLRAEVRYLPGLEIHRDTATGEEWHVLSVEAGLSRVRVLHWVANRPMDIRNDQLRFCLSDHLKSCTLELDEQGALLSREVYYPFGGTALWAGSSETELKYKTIRYSGKERDATGLYYYGHRYYAPWLQRWVSADPVGSVDGLNLFLFCGNSPIANVDRQGLSWSESRFRSRYGPISYLDEQSEGREGERIVETVTSGLDAAIYNLEFVAASLGSPDGREKPDPVAAYYVKNTFGPRTDLDELIWVLDSLKETLKFFSERPGNILFVERPYVKKFTGQGVGDVRLYSGVRIVPKDPKERMVISVDELNSEGTLDIAFLHAAAIERGAHEVMPYARGYPMIASPATAYVGDDLLNGVFDDVIISLARERLLDSDLKYFFGTKNSVDLGLKLKSDSAVRGRFLMHDAGVLSYFVKTVSHALKGLTPERYPLELRAKMSETYRPPKGAS